MASQLAEALNVSGVALIDDLDRLDVDCPAAIQPYVGNSSEYAKKYISAYIQQCKELSHSLVRAPEMLERAHRISRRIGYFLLACATVPSLAVVVCIIVITATVFAMEHGNGKCVRRCERCSHACLGIGCVAPVMLLIALVAAVELALSITASSFCLKPDSTALGYAQSAFGANSNAFNLTRYYVTGEGTNPALLHLEQAQERIAKSEQWMARYGDAIERTCPRWAAEQKALLNLRMVRSSLKETVLLLRPANVYSYYSDSVHEVVCEHAVSGLGSIAFLQLLLGLVCLPLLLCTASCTVEILRLERHGMHGFGLLSQVEGECAGEQSHVESWADQARA